MLVSFKFSGKSNELVWLGVELDGQVIRLPASAIEETVCKMHIELNHPNWNWKAVHEALVRAKTELGMEWPWK